MSVVLVVQLDLSCRFWVMGATLILAKCYIRLWPSRLKAYGKGHKAKMISIERGLSYVKTSMKTMQTKKFYFITACLLNNFGQKSAKNLSLWPFVSQCVVHLPWDSAHMKPKVSAFIWHAAQLSIPITVEDIDGWYIEGGNRGSWQPLGALTYFAPRASRWANMGF